MVGPGGDLVVSWQPVRRPGTAYSGATSCRWDGVVRLPVDAS